MSDETSTDRETLITDSIVPQILSMTSFLGNLDFPDNFRQYQSDRTSNYAFREARSDDVQLVVLFGEVAPYLHGTKLGAIGNHYRGKPGEPFAPITDKSNTKDILKLKVPRHSNVNATLVFNNQLAPLNQVYEYNQDEDRRNRKAPLSVSEWVDCTAAPDADRRIVDLITITLPKKFGSGTSTTGSDHSPPSLLFPAPAKQASTLLARSTRRVAVTAPPVQASQVAGSSSSNAGAQPVPQITPILGELYNPNLMPDYCPDQFNLVNDMLVQHDIRDISKELIPCWKNAEYLRPGTVVMVLASLDIYNIMIERTDPKRGFRRYYQINARKVQVMAESLDTYDPPTLPNISSSTDVPSVSNNAANSAAVDEFNNFTTKKREENRKSSVNADTGKHHSTRAAAKARVERMDVEN